MGRGSVTERLKSSGIEIFKGIARVAPNVAEYWIEEDHGRSRLHPQVETKGCSVTTER